MYYYDATYILVILAFFLALFASFGVNGTFKKYNEVFSSRGLTAVSYTHLRAHETF